MRKIVDSNYYVNPQLRHYLDASKSNYVMLCEYAGIEAYKARNPVDAIHASISILKNYPKQVIVLKSSRTISTQKIMKRGYLDRMVDFAQTRDFSDFCKNVVKAKAGFDPCIKAITHLARHAIAEAENAARSSREHIAAAEEVIKQFTRSELKLIGNGEDLPSTLFTKIVDHLSEMTIHFYDGIETDVRKEQFSDVINSLTFRHLTSSYLMTLRWYANGGPPKNENKIRNHVYDCGFASYATMFDGLLSADIAAQGYFRETKRFLDRLNL